MLPEEGEAPIDLAWDDSSRLAAWRDVIKFTQTALQQQSKSLELATRCVDALTRVHGFAGFRDGLLLLRRITEECWERLHPKIDLSEADELSLDDFADEAEYHDERNQKLQSLMESALEAIAGQYLWLDSPKDGAMLPTVLREIPLARKGIRILSDYALNPTVGQPSVTKEDLPAFALALGQEALQNLVDDLVGAKSELDALQSTLESKFDTIRVTEYGSSFVNQAPYFRNLRSTLDTIHGLVETLQSSYDSSSTGAESASEPSSASTGGFELSSERGTGVALDRSGLYRQLAEIAARLEQFEPHSPVPMLLRRVSQMEKLSFPELVRQLTREEKVLGFLERDLLERPTETDSY
jgi:type VI secretion system protein ImpA